MSDLKNKYSRFTAIMSCLLSNSNDSNPIYIQSISQYLSIPVLQLRRDILYILSSPALRIAYDEERCENLELEALVDKIYNCDTGWETLPIHLSFDMLSPYSKGYPVYLTPMERTLFYNTIGAIDKSDEILLIKDTSPESDSKIFAKRLAVIQTAIDSERLISFRYLDTKGEATSFTIRPQRILEDIDSQHCYCVSINQNSDTFPFYLFRLDRIYGDILLEKANADHQIPDDPALLSCFDYVWGANLDSSVPVQVRLKIFDANNHNVIEKIRVETARRKYGTLEQDPSDPLIWYYTDRVIGMSSFRRWILKYGMNIVVLEPKDLALSICDSARRKLDSYHS